MLDGCLFESVASLVAHTHARAVCPCIEVALLQADDGRYHLEKGHNNGDSGDLWHSGSCLKELGPGPAQHPNTDLYYQGNISKTGSRIIRLQQVRQHNDVPSELL